MGHSCNQAVCELIGKIAKNTEKNWTTVCVFLDLSKAFDTLEHSVVFQKLERYGIRGTALDWFKSYQSNRKIRVKINKFQITIDAALPLTATKHRTSDRRQITKK